LGDSDLLWSTLKGLREEAQAHRAAARRLDAMALALLKAMEEQENADAFGVGSPLPGDH
jgi:hypothetical protein